ncbi:hypothetical protein CDAR_43891 [Caerostris darwini]|uniref:Uncharacterized protein n=1 Tax=Caerostris darwini TaxID=1538125 RepID=A0AAV4WIW2_9ARAC|nr:hypothetical protein CDAR_43891 [Caerostris darwini]
MLIILVSPPPFLRQKGVEFPETQRWEISSSLYFITSSNAIWVLLAPFGERDCQTLSLKRTASSSASVSSAALIKWETSVNSLNRFKSYLAFFCTKFSLFRTLPPSTPSPRNPSISSVASRNSVVI